MAIEDTIALVNYSEQKGSALIRDSSDWQDRIIPALQGLDTVAALNCANPSELVNALRCIIEAIYKLGYERGQREARNPLPVFVVAEEQEIVDD